MFTPMQRRMIGHGALMMGVAMVAGVGLLMSLLGGLEVWPGQIVLIHTPASPPAWVRTHVGGLLNAMLVMLVAVLLPGLGFSQRMAGRIAAGLVGTGWANTLFYWVAMWVPNRALSFGDNRLGSSHWLATVGLLPALIFVFVSMLIVALIAKQAWRKT